MTTKTRHPKTMQAKSKTHAVTYLGNNKYRVVSGESGKVYTVTVLADGGAQCTCDWAKYRTAASGYKCSCSHTFAAFGYITRDNGGVSVSAWATAEDATRQHRKVLDIGDGILLTARMAA